jgi:hypothetical protein
MVASPRPLIERLQSPLLSGRSGGAAVERSIRWRGCGSAVSDPIGPRRGAREYGDARLRRPPAAGATGRPLARPLSAACASGRPRASSACTYSISLSCRGRQRRRAESRRTRDAPGAPCLWLLAGMGRSLHWVLSFRYGTNGGRAGAFGQVDRRAYDRIGRRLRRTGRLRGSGGDRIADPPRHGEFHLAGSDPLFFERRGRSHTRDFPNNRSLRRRPPPLSAGSRPHDLLPPRARARGPGERWVGRVVVDRGA